jgi:hypothetical protein
MESNEVFIVTMDDDPTGFEPYRIIDSVWSSHEAAKERSKAINEEGKYWEPKVEKFLIAG